GDARGGGLVLPSPPPPVPRAPEGHQPGAGAGPRPLTRPPASTIEPVSGVPRHPFRVRGPSGHVPAGRQNPGHARPTPAPTHCNRENTGESMNGTGAPAPRPQDEPRVTARP